MSFLIGEGSAIVNDIKPAQTIADEMVEEAIVMLKLGNMYIKPQNGCKCFICIVRIVIPTTALRVLPVFPGETCD
jgi:hypothetical protein